MFSRLISTSPSLGVSLFSLTFKEEHDKVTVGSTDSQPPNTNSGWDGVKQLFQKDEFDQLSMGASTICQTTFISTFIGFVYGGVVTTRDTYTDFMKSFNASTFQSHNEAKRALMDKMTKSFARGGLRWSWRLTLFTSTYVTTSTCIAAYRGKSGILEHVVGGTISGALYKLKDGPRPMLVGCVLGMALGTIAGSVTYGMLSLIGMTMEEVQYYNYKWLKKREDTFYSNITPEDRIKLLIEREAKMLSTKSNLDSVEK